MPSQLNQHQERKLLKAVEAVSSAIADGDDSTHAAIKVAESHELPPAMIRLVCQSTNIGKVNHMRKQASTLAEKFAYPDPIDPQAVIDAVYGGKKLTTESDKVAVVYSKRPTVSMTSEEEEKEEKKKKREEEKA